MAPPGLFTWQKNIAGPAGVLLWQLFFGKQLTTRIRQPRPANPAKTQRADLPWRRLRPMLSLLPVELMTADD